MTNSTKKSNPEAGGPIRADSAQDANAADSTKERLFTLDFISATIANFANTLGISMLMATIPIYVISLGGNKTAAGLVSGAAQLTVDLAQDAFEWACEPPEGYDEAREDANHLAESDIGVAPLGVGCVLEHPLS